MTPAIAVVGEALVDLVVGSSTGSSGGPSTSSSGAVSALPGGGPFNTARTLARLGASSMFVGGLSGDGFGRMLRGRLDADGVLLGVPSVSALPTTMAVADVNEAGGATYSFYLSGTAAADLDYATLRDALPVPPDLAAVHVGTLGLVMEPIASSVERLVTEGLQPETPLMVDPNCRPGAIDDRDAYLRRLSRIFARADVVKASVEDLAYLYDGAPPDKGAAAVLNEGAGLVIVTDGPRPVRAFLPDGREISVSVPTVDVVDTIGAGDAFGGGFLAKWAGSGMTRARLAETDALRDALAFAAKVSAVTCTRPGADPPRLAELEQHG